MLIKDGKSLNKIDYTYECYATAEYKKRYRKSISSTTSAALVAADKRFVYISIIIVINIISLLHILLENNDLCWVYNRYIWLKNTNCHYYCTSAEVP